MGSGSPMVESDALRCVSVIFPNSGLNVGFRQGPARQRGCAMLRAEHLWRSGESETRDPRWGALQIDPVSCRAQPQRKFEIGKRVRAFVPSPVEGAEYQFEGQIARFDFFHDGCDKRMFPR